MKKSWKSKLAQATNGNQELNKKALQLKKSWDEVEKLLRPSGKANKKSK